MMITANIEVSLLRVPLNPGGASAASAWGDQDLPVVDSVFDKITTDDGVKGWGEAFGFRAVPSVKLAIEDLIAPLCVGRDAERIASLRSEVRRAVDAGFRCLKLHETEPAVVSAAREEDGPDVELMLDVNCAWTLNEAQGKADELQKFGVKWLVEPVWPPENYAGLAHLRTGRGIPIAAGENVATLMEFERLMAAEAIDFVQPSPAKREASPSYANLPDRGRERCRSHATHFPRFASGPTRDGRTRSGRHHD
jgi:L-alanine-DL-glutamate epimerase-like enolase superfamily enzyme